MTGRAAGRETIASALGQETIGQALGQEMIAPVVGQETTDRAVGQETIAPLVGQETIGAGIGERKTGVTTAGRVRVLAIATVVALLADPRGTPVPPAAIRGEAGSLQSAYSANARKWGA